MSAKYYTGVGSRQTPPDILAFMEAIATRLATQGYILRSGHADGADQAFERGAGGLAQVYLPWPNFNAATSCKGCVYCLTNQEYLRRYGYLIQLGLRHPGSKTPVQLLHGRNVCQVEGYGSHAPLSRFLICWCPLLAGQPQGGTATAVKLAEYHQIPVFNLILPESRHRLEDWLASPEELP